MKNKYKNILKNDVVKNVENKYEKFEIPEGKIGNLYDTLPELEVDGNTNLYFSYTFLLSNLVEQYLMKKIKNGDVVSQILLAEMKKRIIIRFLNVKKLNNFTNCHDLFRYADNLSDEIMEEIKESYDNSDTVENEYIKILRKKFN